MLIELKLYKAIGFLKWTELSELECSNLVKEKKKISFNLRGTIYGQKSHLSYSYLIVINSINIF